MNSIYERFCTCGVGLQTFRERRVLCRTFCSRTRVFKSCIYDSAKGWGFTESPCFFLHIHFIRNVPLLRDIFFIWLYWLAVTGGRPQRWHHLLLIPSFTASDRSSKQLLLAVGCRCPFILNNLKRAFISSFVFAVNQPLLILQHCRGSHDEVTAEVPNFFFFLLQLYIYFSQRF